MDERDPTKSPSADVQASDVHRTPSGSYRAGHRLGKYVLEGTLGRGGMGLVYRARHVDLDRVVALKVLLPGPDLHADDIARFVREAKLLAGLRHPNIVPLHDFDQAEGVHFYTMDLVEGEDLGDRLARGAIPVKRALEILRDAARGVAHAHEQGVIHRDLKPGNILLGKDGRVFVTDFGLAKRIGNEKELTASGSMVGTPAYMSPEQAAGDTGMIDARSDVYGLGAVLYHALTGRTPFDGPNLYEILCRVMEEEPPPMPRGVARDAQVICLKCLEKGPSHRYADAGELADDIDRFLSGEAIVGRPSGLMDRAWRRVLKGKMLSVVGATSLLLIGALAFLQIRATADRRREAERHLAAARALEADGRLVEAIARIDSVYAIDSGHAEARALDRSLRDRVRRIDELEAQAHSVSSREECLRAIDGILAINPRHARAYLLRAKVRELVHDFDRAYEDLSRAISLRPDDAEAYVRRAHLLDDRDDGERARPDYERAAQLLPESATGAVCRVRATHLRGDGERALAMAEEAVRRWPTEVALRGAHADILKGLGRAENAERAYRDAIERCAPHAELWRGLATLLVDLGRHAEAEQVASRAAALFPQRPEVYQTLAIAMFHLDRLDDVERALLAAENMEPGRPDVEAEFARLHLRRGELGDARRRIDRALALNPRRAETHVVHGLVLSREGRHPEAIAAYRQATRLEPRSGHAWNNLAALLEGDEAVAAFRQAVAVSPRLWQAWYGLGYALLRRDELGAAQEAFVRSLDINQNYGWTHGRLGYISERNGQHEEAERHYTAALACGGCEELHIGRARARVNQGKVAAAREELEWVIRNLPSSREEAQRLLDQLPK